MPLTLAGQTKTVGEWTALSRINRATVHQRIRRGDLPLQALATSDREGNCLRLTAPPFPCCDVGFAPDGTVTLHAMSRESLESLHVAVFGDDETTKFADAIAEFAERDQITLLRIKAEVQDAIGQLKEAGAAAMSLRLSSCRDHNLLVELFLRRQGVLSTRQNPTPGVLPLRVPHWAQERQQEHHAPDRAGPDGPSLPNDQPAGGSCEAAANVG